MRLNEHFKNLGESYLFVTIAKKVAAYQQEHPEEKIIRLGIGDVTRPLAPAVIDALHRAVEDQARQETFHGYSPDSDGYPFLREAIAGYYKNFGVELDPSEIFVGDGAKSDLGNMLDLFDRDNTVLIPDPVYPVYVDTNVMDGRPIVYLDATEENGFLPLPDPGRRADLIYLCSPNNPTGAAYNKEQLQAWVEYALEQKAVLLYDAAYEAFITEPGLPHSIFEIPGAKRCAMEFCSLSKTAGFTGMRCGYTVLPRELCFGGVSLGKLWQRRQGCKFNGVSYLTQRGAQAVFTPEGQRQIREAIACYQENARVMMEALDRLGIPYTGGVNSPYLWLKCPEGLGSWDYFDFLLERAQIVGTPGEGFGRNGEGWFRLTAFGDPAQTREAMARLERLGQ